MSKTDLGLGFEKIQEQDQGQDQTHDRKTKTNIKTNITKTRPKLRLDGKILAKTTQKLHECCRISNKKQWNIDYLENSDNISDVQKIQNPQFFFF